MAFGIIACLLVAVVSLIRAYVDHYPVASVGECLRVKSATLTTTVKVMGNNNAAGSSLVMFESNGYLLEVSYGELRSLNATVVDCK